MVKVSFAANCCESAGAAGEFPSLDLSSDGPLVSFRCSCLICNLLFLPGTLLSSTDPCVVCLSSLQISFARYQFPSWVSLNWGSGACHHWPAPAPAASCCESAGAAGKLPTLHSLYRCSRPETVSSLLLSCVFAITAWEAPNLKMIVSKGMSIQTCI